jgi:transcriptional regulator with XRE-family HTH domain
VASALYAYIMNTTLGGKIRELREKKDISLREFAKKLDGASAAHVSDIELGHRYPSDSLLGKIASLLDISVEDLQKFDNRAPVDELKRLAQADPAFGFALRTLVDKKVTPEDILKLAEQRPNRGKP